MSGRVSGLPSLEPDEKPQIISRSQEMQAHIGRLNSAAASDANVFITGESGVGKALSARVIHQNSMTPNAAYVVFNCAIHTAQEQIDNLLQPGTGAIARAAGGTLVLDNASDLSIQAQRKLLDFTETRATSGPGVRLISTCTQEPLELLNGGHFREDLFYRLRVLGIRHPALRERRADIIPLARQALEEFSTIEGKSFSDFEASAADTLCALPWPGNVRQLRNAIHQIVVLNDATLVSRSMICDRIEAEQRTVPPEKDCANSAGKGLIGGTLADIEQWAIEETIKLSNGSLPRAARVLDVAPSTLYRKREAWAKRPLTQADETKSG